MISSLSRATLLLLALTLLGACGKRFEPTSQRCLIGSEEMAPAIDNWLSTYHARLTDDPSLHYSFEPWGNATVARALARSQCPIGAMSRPMQSHEVEQLIAAHGGLPIVIPVAIEALVVVASPQLPLESITLEQLATLYRNTPDRLGESELFASIDGDFQNEQPLILGLNSASDRFRWFRDSILDGDQVSDRIIELSGPLAMGERLLTERAAFGYLRPAEVEALNRRDNAPAIRQLALIDPQSGATIEATRSTIGEESYPWLRYHYLYLPSNLEPDQPLHALISHILSAEGQAVLTLLGLYPLSESTRLEALARLPAPVATSTTPTQR